MVRRGMVVTAVAVLLVGLQAADASAQRFGAQLSWADDTDLAVGARVEWPLPLAPDGLLSRALAIGSFDWFFPDCETFVAIDDTDFDCSYWELNANAALPILAGGGVSPYVGAGLNLAHFTLERSRDGARAEDSDFEAGLNLVGGLRFPLGGVTAFAEARGEISGGEQFVVTAGLLLGGR